MSEMYSKKESRISDVGTERAVLAGVCQYGRDGFVDIADLVTDKTFTIESNQILFSVLDQVLQKSERVDIASIVSTSKSLGVYDVIAKEDKDIEYLRALFNFPIHLENVRGLAKKLAKLALARLAQSKLKSAYDKLSGVRGDESLDEILGIPESAIFDLIQEVNKGREDQPELITADSDELLQHLIDHPCEMVGLPTPWKYYNSAIGGGLRRGGTNLISARPKCLDINSLVLTFHGPKKLKDLTHKDILCHPDGTTSKILHIYPEYKTDGYIIKFNDGSTVQCTKDHLWRVKHRRKKEYCVKTTQEILDTGLQEGDGRDKWHIENCKPVLFKHKNIDLDPYLLGLLLGDGGITECVSFTTADSFLISYIKENIEDNHKVTIRGKYSFCLVGKNRLVKNKYRQILKKYKLLGRNSHNKFIPKDYLYNSVEVRTELLRGLLDTDGCANLYTIEYSTTSKRLAKEVKFLVESLGGKCIAKRRKTSCQNKWFWSYRLLIAFNDNSYYFKLPRKKEIASTRKKNKLTRTIREIIPISNLTVKCIKTDRDDGLFLTNNCITTHNCGKSTFGKEVALHLTLNLKIPVLYLDTEMVKTDQLFRSLASISEVPFSLIETGKFGRDTEQYNRVMAANKLLKNNPLFFHKKVAGKEFEEVLSIIRRWIVKEVGYDANGNVNDCLVIYDYFKLMTPDKLQSMQEYQALGFQISRLSDFNKEYDFPCLAFVQTSREGLVAQSDRLVWLCHSVSYFKTKTPEEILEDGKENGNRKLEIMECRFGGGMEPGNYINMNMKGDIAKILELKTKAEVIQAKNNSTSQPNRFETEVIPEIEFGEDEDES